MTSKVQVRPFTESMLHAITLNHESKGKKKKGELVDKIRAKLFRAGLR